MKAEEVTQLETTVRAANPYPSLEAVAASKELVRMDALVRLGTSSGSVPSVHGRDIMRTQQRPPRRTRPQTRSGWVAAGFAFAVVLVIGFGLALLRAPFGGEEMTVADQPTATVAPVVTTLPPTAPLVQPVTEGPWQQVGVDVMEPVVGILDMTVVGSGLVAVGFDPGADFRQDGVIFTSDDGVNWVRLAEDDPALTRGFVLMYAVTEGGPGLVAVGLGCEDATEACSKSPERSIYATAWTSVDGASWTRTSQDPAVFGDPATQTSSMNDVTATATGSLVAVGSLDDWTLDDSGVEESVVTHPATWTSPDGVVWERTWLGEGFELTADVWENVDTATMNAIVQDPDGGFVAVGAMLDQDGESTAAVWTSTDGSTWDRIDPTSPVFGQKTTMTDVTWGLDGYVAVGTEGGLTPAIWTSPDGRSWTRVDISNEPFDNSKSLGSVAALGSGYVATGPWIGAPGEWPWIEPVSVWTSLDGSRWNQVLEVDGHYAQAIAVINNTTVIAGAIYVDDDVHAAVWAGPAFDPENPPSDPLVIGAWNEE